MRRIVLFLVILAGASATADPGITGNSDPVFSDPERQRIIGMLAGLDRTRNVLITIDGQPVFEHVNCGPGLNQPAKIKSVAMIVVSALVGAAIECGGIEGSDQPIVELLGDAVPADAHPRVAGISVSHLLSMYMR